MFSWLNKLLLLLVPACKDLTLKKCDLRMVSKFVVTKSNRQDYVQVLIFSSCGQLFVIIAGNNFINTTTNYCHSEIKRQELLTQMIIS